MILGSGGCCSHFFRVLFNGNPATTRCFSLSLEVFAKAKRGTWNHIEPGLTPTGGYDSWEIIYTEFEINQLRVEWSYYIIYHLTSPNCGLNWFRRGVTNGKKSLPLRVHESTTRDCNDDHFVHFQTSNPSFLPNICRKWNIRKHKHGWIGKLEYHPRKEHQTSNLSFLSESIPKFVGNKTPRLTSLAQDISHTIYRNDRLYQVGQLYPTMHLPKMAITGGSMPYD